MVRDEEVKRDGKRNYSGSGGCLSDCHDSGVAYGCFRSDEASQEERLNSESVWWWAKLRARATKVTSRLSPDFLDFISLE